MSGVETLVEMGFLKNRAEKAWAITGERGGVQAAMEWLLQHNEDADIDEPYKPPEGRKLGKPDGNKSMDTTEQEQPAVTEKETPLTAEQKQEKLQQIQEKLKKRRLEKEAEEKKREIEMEVSRRRQGQDISKIKADIQFKEAQKLAEIRKREKREDMIARQRVKEQIAIDRADKKAQQEAAKLAKSEQLTQSSSTSKPSPIKEVKNDHTHARLQIRLPNGTQIVQQFGAQEPLSAVHLFVELNRKDGHTDPFDLMTAFPKQVFSKDDLEKPLKLLGLCPSAVIMVTKPH